MGEGLNDDGEDRGGDDRDQHTALDAAHVQDEHEEDAEHEDERRPAVERARDAELNGGRAGAHDARVDEADEGHEEAQAHRDGGLEGGGNRAENGLTEARENEQEDEDTFPRDDAHGLAVAEAGAEDEGKGDDRVEAKACGERQRVVRDDAHEDRHDARDERGTSGDALGRNGTVFGNGITQDRRVDDQDVRHREEGDKSTADFVTDRRAALGDLEERIK